MLTEYEDILSSSASCLGTRTQSLPQPLKICRNKTPNSAGMTWGKGTGSGTESFGCGDSLYFLSLVGYSFYPLDAK